MSFFSDCNHIAIPGRQFPVDVYYTKEPEEDFIDAALLTILQIHAEEESGGILVFLPGQDDIENLIVMLEEHLPSIKHKHMNSASSSSLASNEFKDFCVLPLYSALSQEEQMKAFEPSQDGIRKIVVATNIAETSLTIAGVKYVVDTGFNKNRSVNGATGVESLRTAPISQSQANQRAGRAGRESAGKCFRLYTEDAFENLALSAVPEIRRVNITQVVLQLKVLGVKDPETFPLPSPPSAQSVTRAVVVLVALGALDKTTKVCINFTSHLISSSIFYLFLGFNFSWRKYGSTSSRTHACSYAALLCSIQLC
jgi:HrpA-like RNA helicase